MKKPTFRKVLTTLGILIAGILLMEAIFIVDSLITKAKSDEEIAQTFADFLSNKQYFRAYHLMCNGPAALSPFTNYLASSSFYGSQNTKKLVYEMKLSYQNTEKGQTALDLKIYPEDQNLADRSPNFAIVRNSQSLFSPCISTQAG